MRRNLPIYLHHMAPAFVGLSSVVSHPGMTATSVSDVKGANTSEDFLMANDLLTHREAMAFLNVSSACLQRWRILGGGPQFVKLGKGRTSGVRYARSELRRFKKTYVKTNYPERTYPLEELASA